MQFYLKPVGEPRCIFIILNEDDRSQYVVVEKNTSLGCKFFLLDCNHSIVGRISGVRISDAVQYSIAAGGKRMRVAVDYTSVRRPVRIRGKRWRFRGDMLTRSFDILNTADQVVMTHGKCWSMARDCYAIDISDEENVPLFLCLAAIIDLTISGGCTAPLPAGG